MKSAVRWLRQPEADVPASVLLSDLGVSDTAKAELREAVERCLRGAVGWGLFSMINQDQARFVMRAIHEGTARPAITQRVWDAALYRMRFDTGEVAATRKQLAEDALTNPDEVSRAMGELVKIGALIRERRGKRAVYLVNARVGWAGSEPKRRQRAASAPELRLVES